MSALPFPDSVEQLKEYLKQKSFFFPDKVYAALKYSLSHPSDILQTGIFWLNDGESFLCSAEIFAALLGIKPNSVNTNFRERNFKIETLERHDVPESVPIDQRTKKWKKRRLYGFTKNSNANDVQKMMQYLSQMIPESFAYHNEFLSQEDRQFFQNDISQLRSVVMILNNIEFPFSEQGRKDILTKAREIWQSNISPMPMSQVTTAISGILKDSDSQLEMNLSSILSSQDNSSQASNSLSFESFLKFFIRFSSPDDPVHVLRSITSECGYKSFFAYTDKITASDKLGIYPNGYWVVVPSKAINQFTLLVKNYGEVMASHIKYDCTKGIFYADGCPQGENDIESFAINAFKLNPSFVMDPSRRCEKPRYVKADEIIQMMDQAKEDTQSQFQWGTPTFFGHSQFFDISQEF